MFKANRWEHTRKTDRQAHEEREKTAQLHWGRTVPYPGRTVRVLGQGRPDCPEATGGLSAGTETETHTAAGNSENRPRRTVRELGLDCPQVTSWMVREKTLQERTVRAREQGTRTVREQGPDSPTFTSQKTDFSDRLLDSTQPATSDNPRGTGGQSGVQNPKTRLTNTAAGWPRATGPDSPGFDAGQSAPAQPKISRHETLSRSPDSPRWEAGLSASRRTEAKRRATCCPLPQIDPKLTQIEISGHKIRAR